MTTIYTELPFQVGEVVEITNYPNAARGRVRMALTDGTYIIDVVSHEIRVSPGGHLISKNGEVSTSIKARLLETRPGDLTRTLPSSYRKPSDKVDDIIALLLVTRDLASNTTVPEDLDKLHQTYDRVAAELAHLFEIDFKSSPRKAGDS